jgi:hypothetical protein
VPFALLRLLTLRDALPLNASGRSLGLQRLSVRFDENCESLAIDAMFRALAPLSRARKQRRDSPLHGYTGSGGPPIMRLHGQEEAIRGR